MASTNVGNEETATNSSTIKYKYDGEKRPGEIVSSAGKITEVVDNSGDNAASSLGIEGRYRSRLDSMENGSIVINLNHEIRLKNHTFINFENAFSYIFKYLSRIQDIFKDTELLTRDNLLSLADEMNDAAVASEVNPFRVYSPLAPIEIAEDFLSYQEAMSRLWVSETCSLAVGGNEEIELSKKNITSKEHNISILTDDELTIQSKENLQIRKPDLIGTTMWELIREGRNIRARMNDLDWLTRFHEDRVKIQTGSGILVDLIEHRFISASGETFRTEYSIEKVYEQTDFSENE